MRRKHTVAITNEQWDKSMLRVIDLSKYARKTELVCLNYSRHRLSDLLRKLNGPMETLSTIIIWVLYIFINIISFFIYV